MSLNLHYVKPKRLCRKLTPIHPLPMATSMDGPAHGHRGCVPTATKTRTFPSQVPALFFLKNFIFFYVQLTIDIYITAILYFIIIIIVIYITAILQFIYSLFLRKRKLKLGLYLPNLIHCYQGYTILVPITLLVMAFSFSNSYDHTHKISPS